MISNVLVLLRDEIQTVFDTVPLDPNDISELKHDTVKDLIGRLDATIQTTRPNPAPVVMALCLYGRRLRLDQPLASLLVPSSGDVPRLMALTSTTRECPAGHIVVLTLTNQTFFLAFDPQSLVADLKGEIEKTTKFPTIAQRLIFLGEELDDHCTLGSHGILPRTTVRVVLKLRGGGIDPHATFADVSNPSLLTQQQLVANAPPWRRCRKGLNMEGRCTTRSCPAFTQLVIYPNDFHPFNLIEHANVSCPLCAKPVKPETCGFYDCVWRFEGLRASDEVVVRSSWTPAYGHQYHRFDADANHGSIVWKSLLISVLPRGVGEALRVVAIEGVTLHESDRAMCSICWMPVSSLVATMKGITTHCGHDFHSSCLRQWTEWCARASTSASCPMCRTTI